MVPKLMKIVKASFRVTQTFGEPPLKYMTCYEPTSWLMPYYSEVPLYGIGTIDVTRIEPWWSLRNGMLEPEHV